MLDTESSEIPVHFPRLLLRSAGARLLQAGILCALIWGAVAWILRAA